MAQVDYIYDGEGFYITAIEDSLGVSDAIEEMHVFIESFEVVSTGLLSDFITFDTITNVQDDPGYISLKLPSEVIKGLSDTKIMATDSESNLLCLSREFIWKISPTGQVLSKQFLNPIFKNYNADTIKCMKFYQDYLYVLHYDVIPADRYVIIKDFIGMREGIYSLKNNAIPHSQEDIYTSWELANPPDQFSYDLIPSIGVFKFSKFDIATGEEVSNIYINIATPDQINASNGFLFAPVSFDILNDKLFILDNGDAVVKTYDMSSGIFLGKLIDNDLLFAPSAFFMDSVDYAWVVDRSKITNMGVTDQIKKINLRTYAIDEIYDFAQRPIFTFSKSANYSDKIMLLRDGQAYKYFYDFVEDNSMSTLLSGHAIQSIHIANSTEMYVWNSNPFDIRRINLNTKATTNIRDCYEPISITKEFVEGNTALLSDTGLKEVGIYHFHGERSGTLIDHVHPKGIAKIGSDYYITDIDEGVILKYSASTLTKLQNYDVIRPTDITTDGTFLYITDCGKNAIIKMNTDGITQKIIGTSGKQDGQFTYPIVTLLSGNEMFVLDSGNFRVQVMDLNGVFLRKYQLSPTPPPETLRKTTVTATISDIDDSSETIDGTESIWGDIPINSGARFAAFRFTLNVPQKAVIQSAVLKVNKLSSVDGQVWITVENSANPQQLSTTNSGIYDLLYRPKLSQTLWYMPVGVNSSLSSPDITAQIQAIVYKPDWHENSAITIILQFDSRVNQNTVLKSVSSSINLTYDIVKQTRNQGLYNHMVMDDTSLYVADIARNFISVLDKNNGNVTDSYNFVGTVMEKLSEDIFISNRDCNISYLQKFKFHTDAFYNLEFDSDATAITFNFEPNWVVEFTEDFNHAMQVDFLEDYEWLTVSAWDEVTMPTEYPSADEFDLAVPAITWRDA